MRSTTRARRAAATARGMAAGRRVGAGRRRGSVIVLVVAVLAVIAIAAVAYVTVVRIDRSSSAAYATTVNYQQQVNALIEEIRAQLTADLFGNKYVTSTTPRRMAPLDPNDNTQVLPKMFEDGEFWDKSSVAKMDEFGAETFNRALPGQTPSAGAQLDPSRVDDPRFRIAPPDDAWLASREPYDSTFSPGIGKNWKKWENITNLDAVYRLVDINPAQDPLHPDYKWVRGRGRYCDLAQWFLQRRDNRGNPAADLTSTTPTSGAEWTDPITHAQNGPDAGKDQEVLGKLESQMGDTGAIGSAALFENIDERMWMDVDGDGVPDARWQRLDALGDLFGLKWVVAARIIDNSSMLNVSSNYTLLGGPGFAADLTTLGDGLTPADVDLLRLMRAYAGGDPTRLHYDFNNFGGPPLNVDRSFAEHLSKGVRLDYLLAQAALDQQGQSALQSAYPLLHGVLSSGGGGFTTDLDRLKREALWRYFGASPQDPLATRAVGYPYSDEIDLRMYNAFNAEGLLSKLEQRFDGPENLNQLPGQLGGMGVMRSKDPGATNEARNLNSLNPSPAQRILRWQQDFRRHLTTVNGVGPAGPVPVVSQAADANNRPLRSNDYSTRKVRLRNMVRLKPNAGQTAGVLQTEANPEGVQRAFESLVWALAPLATNAPFMRGVTANDLQAVHDSATLEDFLYGGGAMGPAKALQLASGGTPIKAAYAVLRAACLAVNMADAQDTDDGPLAARPTVARLYPRLTFDTTEAPYTKPPEPTIPLTVRFVQGDVNKPVGSSMTVDVQGMLPKEYVGAPDSGVTLVGLDRQPFLRELVSYAVYQSLAEAVVPAGPTYKATLVTPTDPAQQIGSILAVELGNPWPEPVSVAGYLVRIEEAGPPAHRITLDLGKVAMGSSPTIAPGSVAVFYLAWNQMSSDTTGAWDQVRDKWVNSVTGRPGLGAAGVIELDPAAAIVTGATSTNIATAQPVVFQDFTGTATALLIAPVGSPGVGGQFEVLLDRLAPPNATATFPRTLTGTYISGDDVLFDSGGNPPLIAHVRVAVGSSLFRPTENAAGGFPAYVVERRAANTVEPDGPTDQTHEQVWRDDPEPEMPGDAAVLFDGGTMGNHLGETKGDLPNLPPFQLFVPNGQVAFLSELGLLSVFCHMYVHADGDAGPPKLDTAADATALFGQGRWVTISEQLGLNANDFYNGASGPRNPYLGVLDPTRFILTGDLDSAGAIPSEMRIPLALRVFDCFDALAIDDSLVQGRLNINTTPDEINRVLAYVDPTPDVSMLIPGFASAPSQRALLMLDYRDRVLRRNQAGVVDRDVLTGLQGLRTQALANSQTGFVSSGELAILDRWDPATGNPMPNTGGFAQLGSNGLNDRAPQSPFDRRFARGMADAFAPGVTPPIDDPQERLALYSAVSNTVSTRSDVFTAWFVIRGYDPEAIEAIRVPGPPTDAELKQYMGMLRPKFEQRWLAVFDRSNVRRPTDRPRVLLLVELPIDSPAP